MLFSYALAEVCANCLLLLWQHVISTVTRRGGAWYATNEWSPHLCNSSLLLVLVSGTTRGCHWTSRIEATIRELAFISRLATKTQKLLRSEVLIAVNIPDESNNTNKILQKTLNAYLCGSEKLKISTCIQHK